MVTQLRCLAVSELDESDYHITAPTLVLSGEYDAMVPNCYSKRMADEIPGSEFRMMSGCGHNPVSERPEEALPLLLEFLKRKDKQIAPSGDVFLKPSRNRLRDDETELTYNRTDEENV